MVWFVELLLNILLCRLNFLESGIAPELLK